MCVHCPRFYQVFTKFAKELAITSDNPQFLFQSLCQICVTLSNGTDKHCVSFDSPLLACERVESFLKLLGFTVDYDESAYVITKIDAQVINHALVACREQLVEISKKSSTIQQIVTNRRRNGSISFSHSATSRLRQSIAISSPTPIEEDATTESVSNPAASTAEAPDVPTDIAPDIDDDQCQLYELIWSTTHPITSDHKAKDVILLCYMMITSSLKFLKLLEARFFNDDHGRASCSSDTSADDVNPIPGGSSWNESTPSLVNLPSLKLTMGTVSNASQISLNFDHHAVRIKSSYGVQKKVVHLIRIWMQKYWDEDWHCTPAMVTYVEGFVRRVTRAYANDDEFDDNERNRGLELIGSIHKTVQRQRAEMKFHSTELSLTSFSRILVPSLQNEFEPLKMDGVSTSLHSRIHSEMVPRTRSKSDNKEDRKRDKLEGPKLLKASSTKPRRKSLHKRKISTMFTSSPLHKPRTLSRTNLSGAVSNDLLKVNNKSLSGQLALFLFTKYAAIKPRECLYQYSVRKKPTSPLAVNSNGDEVKPPLESSPNIKVYKETFNHIVKWVQSSILLQQQVGKRARIIKKWIKVADQLFNLRCFQGFVAVQCALNSSAIYSLKEAWNQHSVLKRKHHTKLCIHFRVLPAAMICAS